MTIRFGYLQERLSNTYSKKELNEGIKNLLFSQPFPFRERCHIIITQEDKYTYPIPRNSQNRVYKLRNEVIPSYAYIESEDNTSVIFNNTLYKEKVIIICEYLTTSVGESNLGNEITKFSKEDDLLYIPTHLSTLFIDMLKNYLDFQRSTRAFSKYSGLKDKLKLAY